ncbi:MAG: hypothetical protein OHK0022_21950 [Roseiflexaceae bacterium]
MPDRASKIRPASMRAAQRDTEAELRTQRMPVSVPAPRMSRGQPALFGSADILAMQRTVGNRAVGLMLHTQRAYERSGSAAAPSSKGGAMIQRYEEYDLSNLHDVRDEAVNFLFSKRVEEGDATSGVHNYAYAYGINGVWAKSKSNGHAEIMILNQIPRDGIDELTIISEFKPCKYCSKDMEEFEHRHGIKIEVCYLIDYAATGDGDKDKVRKFYKDNDKLTGGGKYVYSIK